ncbi:MAG: DNA polymerase IV [bacterium]
MPRIIFHIDINAFFASVEQRDNPVLRGKPVAVAGHGARTVILTASYEARKFGVRTGMRVPEALAKCPQLALVHPHNNQYVKSSQRILEILHEFSPNVEVFSIDEAFVDMTECIHLFPGPLEAAKQMKGRIRQELGLACSVGIAPTKVLAKLASDLQKPDGLVWIRAEEVAGKLKDLDVSALWGIGPKMRMHLAGMGIRRIGELAVHPRHELVRRFGKYGEYLHDIANGKDASPVVALEDEPDAKSVGHTLTVEKDLQTKEEIKRYLLQVAEEVARRMRKGGYSGRTVALVLRYSDFETFSRRVSLKMVTDDGRRIYAVASALLDAQALKPLGIRLVGISVSNFAREFPQAYVLPGEERKRRLNAALDAVNDRYGEFTLKRADIPAKKAVKRPISPSWRPDESRRRAGGA